MEHFSTNYNLSGIVCNNSLVVLARVVSTFEKSVALELTLFYTCHNNNKSNNNKKSHQNLSEGVVLEGWTYPT